jgi:hypothetical protein
LALSMIASITARGTGSFLKPRTLRRDWTSVSNSTSRPPCPFIPWHCKPWHRHMRAVADAARNIYANPQARPRTL